METIPIVKRDPIEHVKVPKLNSVPTVGMQDGSQTKTFVPIRDVQGNLDLLPPLLLALGIQAH